MNKNKIILVLIITLFGFYIYSSLKSSPINVSAQTSTPTPTNEPVNCDDYTGSWRIDTATPIYSNGNVGFTIEGSFPKIAQCGRRTHSLVYIYMHDSTGTLIDRSYYYDDLSQVSLVNEDKINLLPVFAFADASWRLAVKYCYGTQTAGDCTASGAVLKYPVAITNPSLTLTPSPTVTSSPSATPVLSPTLNPNCQCRSDNICSWDPICIFETYNDVSYAKYIKCSREVNIVGPTPDTATKTAYCQRPQRTKGDVDGADGVTNTDYFYYVSAVNGGGVPAFVNADVNGDGLASVDDRAIIVRTLKEQGLSY